MISNPAQPKFINNSRTLPTFRGSNYFGSDVQLLGTGQALALQGKNAYKLTEHLRGAFAVASPRSLPKMQKLLKRTAQVEKQAARRNRAAHGKNTSDTRRILQRQKAMHNKARRELYVSARQAQREDWYLGPLAPRRDVGDKAETYGTVPLRMIDDVEKMDGKWKKYGIREGDRVCIVGAHERDRGKIGVVREVKERAESCKVRGVNMVCLLRLRCFSSISIIVSNTTLTCYSTDQCPNTRVHANLWSQ